ncbi:MAG: hypothetical protein IKE69_11795 [Thermoguttaceae bacterium]|nr:hypothetical protein [Thermoguttaceae bacterium]
MTEENLNGPDAAGASEDEQLTALIDGELSEAEKVEIEKRLAADPRLRARYEKLRAVDDFLGRLELPSVSPEMTTRTMELVTGVVQKELRAARRRARVGAILFFLLLAALSVGAFVAADRVFRGRLKPSVDDRDYPVFSRLDALEAVGTLAFLRELQTLPAFAGEGAGPDGGFAPPEPPRDGRPFSDRAPDGGFAPPEPPRGGRPFSDRAPDGGFAPPGPPREGPPFSGRGPGAEPRETSLSAELGSDDLFLKKIRYTNLSRAERKKYRELYDAVMAEPDAAQLDRTLIRFGNWFRDRLTETERNRLRSEPESGRLALVERLLRESAGRRFSRRSGGRRASFAPSRDPREWLTEMKNALPEELREESLDVRDDLRAFTRQRFEERRKDGAEPSRTDRRILDDFVEAQGFDYFADRLSDRAKEYLASRSDEEKARLVAQLIRLHFFSRVVGRGPHPHGGPDLRSASAGSESTAALAETLRNLPEEEREELLSLPDDEMYELLLNIHQSRERKNGPPSRFSPPDFPKRAGQED